MALLRLLLWTRHYSKRLEMSGPPGIIHTSSWRPSIKSRNIIFYLFIILFNSWGFQKAVKFFVLHNAYFSWQHICLQIIWSFFYWNWKWYGLCVCLTYLVGPRQSCTCRHFSHNPPRVARMGIKIKINFLQN